MQQIVLLLNPAKLTNPDLDLRHHIADRIKARTNGKIKKTGYDYFDCEKGSAFWGTLFKTKNAAQDWLVIMKMIEEERFLDNDLSLSAEIYISEENRNGFRIYTLVYP